MERRRTFISDSGIYVVRIVPNENGRGATALIIHTDEHNFRTLGCYRKLLSEEQALMWGPAVVETPNIDWIAENGSRVRVVRDLLYSKAPMVPVRWVLGTHREEDFLDADLVVPSPAVARNNRHLVACRRRGIPLDTEMKAQVTKIAKRQEDVAKMTEEMIDKNILVPEFPQLTGAIGAALYAMNHG